MKKQYSYSLDEEHYQGPFDSIEDACQEAAEYLMDGNTFWVGENVPPPPPEGYFHAYRWIEHVTEQDEYSGEWAEGWSTGITTEMLNELNGEVRQVIGAWLDRRNLRPRFWNVEHVQTFRCAGVNPDGSYRTEPMAGGAK